MDERQEVHQIQPLINTDIDNSNPEENMVNSTQREVDKNVTKDVESPPNRLTISNYR